MKYFFWFVLFKIVPIRGKSKIMGERIRGAYGQEKWQDTTFTTPHFGLDERMGVIGKPRKYPEHIPSIVQKLQKLNCGFFYSLWWSYDTPCTATSREGVWEIRREEVMDEVLFMSGTGWGWKAAPFLFTLVNIDEHGLRAGQRVVTAGEVASNQCLPAHVLNVRVGQPVWLV